MSGAVALDLVNLFIERADIGAQAFLLGDIGLQLFQIEGDKTSASSRQGLRERTQQSDALFKKFEEAMGFCGHGLGSFIQRMLFFIFSFNQRCSRSVCACRQGLLWLSLALRFAVFFFARGERLNARWTQIFHRGVSQNYALVLTPE